MNTALTQTASEGGAALAAGSDDTQAAAKACRDLPEIAMQMSRLVTAIEEQTKAHQQIEESITGWLQCISNRIEDVGSWVTAGLVDISDSIDDAGKKKAAAPTRRKPKTGGRP